MKETTLTGESKDILNENIETLKELFPEIVSEDKIDFDKFKTIFGGEIDDSSERYSFTWPGKTQAIKESQKQSTGTLRPCKEESKNWDTTKNLYIEGDNLEVLKLLQKGYYNKIKAIYIDPQYNTGKDFVYKDNYKDNLANYLEISGQIEDGKRLTSNMESDGRFHSNWLNMMYPRLKLARNLLSDDGVIFISIDDNEIDNLKKLSDEVFGEENWKATFCWRKTHTQTNIGDFARVKEYILCYSKNIKECKFNKIPLTNLVEYRYEDENGEKFRRVNLIDSTRGRYEYEILNPNGNIVKGKWMKPKEDVEELIKNNDVYWAGETPYGKNYLRDMKKKGQIANDFIGIEYGTNQRSTMHLDKLMGGKRIFDFSKPIDLIKHFIRLSADEDSIILDFFAGSSTTAHSLIQLNSEDEGNRRFIMIQIPENTDEKSDAFEEGYKNICEIGKERIRRAGDKIVQESGNKNLDIGFKVFKLDSSNLNKWDPDYDDLEQTLLVSQYNIKPDRTQEDLIYEIMLKYGIDLILPIEKYDAGENKIYSIGFGALLICLDNKITKDITDSIIELASEDVSRVVFKDNGFASDADKTNIKETLRSNNIDEFITI